MRTRATRRDGQKTIKRERIIMKEMNSRKGRGMEEDVKIMKWNRK
jgi:hypothetical protein